jgi:hypothetical protein
MKGDFVQRADPHHIRIDVQQAVKDGATGVLAAYVPEDDRVVYNLYWHDAPPPPVYRLIEGLLYKGTKRRLGEEIDYEEIAEVKS